MIPIGTTKSVAAFKAHAKKIKHMQDSALASLKETQMEIAAAMNSVETLYLQKVIAYFETDDFLIADPAKLAKLVIDLPPLPAPQNKFKVKKGKGFQELTLSKLIIEDLKYEYNRGTFFPKYFIELGIRACVYCNAQSAFNIKHYHYGSGTIRQLAKYQLDHFYSKDDYPYLSISLFNLYPACAACNLAKLKKPANFKLYDDPQNAVAYAFKLDITSFVQYLNDRSNTTLKIAFDDPDKSDPLIEAVGSLEDTFHITGIYEIQQDLAEELVARAYTYDDALTDTFKTSFNALFTDAALSERIIMGNYTDPKDTHKRVMSKFTQDIARQLAQLKLRYPIKPTGSP